MTQKEEFLQAFNNIWDELDNIEPNPVKKHSAMMSSGANRSAFIIQYILSKAFETIGNGLDIQVNKNSWRKYENPFDVTAISKTSDDYYAYRSAKNTRFYCSKHSSLSLYVAYEHKSKTKYFKCDEWIEGAVDAILNTVSAAIQMSSELTEKGINNSIVPEVRYSSTIIIRLNFHTYVEVTNKFNQNATIFQAKTEEGSRPVTGHIWGLYSN